MAKEQYRVMPGKLHYVAIDGTLVGDSASFCRQLETRGGGWTNLLEYLPLVGKVSFGGLRPRNQQGVLQRAGRGSHLPGCLGHRQQRPVMVRHRP